LFDPYGEEAQPPFGLRTGDGVVSDEHLVGSGERELLVVQI
jgi:hypothetical protein